MKCKYCSCVLPNVPPPFRQPFCSKCGHSVDDHTGTTAASSTLTEPAKRKSELNSAYTNHNTKNQKVKGSEVQIEIWKIDLEFSKKTLKDKPQLAEAMIKAREVHLLKREKVFDQLTFSEVVKTPNVDKVKYFTLPYVGVLIKKYIPS